MTRFSIYFLLFSLFLSAFGTTFSQTPIQHFIFFSQEREGIRDTGFYLNPGITGAQITYPWKRLEPQKDAYDFSEIEEDLKFLLAHGKQLFIQIQDVTFDSTRYAVPPYLLTDTIYHGGANSQYEFPNGDENRAFKAGWVSRRWDPAVSARFHRLLSRLGKQLDGRIAGINLPETSVEFGSTGALYPSGFSNEAYCAAIKANMKALKQAFPQSVALQYANFMPGEWLPKNDHGYLKSLYEYAQKIQVGMGGPDLMVYRKSQMKHSYGLIREIHGQVPTGVAVQDGNYVVINPQTGQQVTVPEIYAFGRDYLQLTYIFWCTEEPYYSKEVLPFLKKPDNK